MQPFAVDASLLRTVLATDVKLAVGRELMARVAAVTAEGRGTLSLAGALLEAELPANVQAGEELRLQVRELTPDRVVLAIRPDLSPPQPLLAAVDPPRVPLPGGGSIQVTEREAHASPDPSQRTHTVTVRYDAPTLGQLDLQFTLAAGALALTVAVAPGAYESVEDHAGQLRDALAEATERPATVAVVPRREPLEVFV
jgi:hypothetical protein